MGGKKKLLAGGDPHQRAGNIWAPRAFMQAAPAATAVEML